MFWSRKKNWDNEYDEYYAQDRRSERKPRTGKIRVVPHLALLGFVGGLFIGGAGVISGPAMAEKLVTSLAMPLGVAWLALMVLVYFCLLSRQPWPAVAGFFCWTVLTIGGNQMVSNELARSLESPFLDVDVDALGPLDTLVVLGGGTGTTTSGQPQLGFAGDRIAVAAKLYHSGNVKQLICTGTQKFRSTADDRHPREEATELLSGLGVPRDVIFQMQGENTSQEMANLKVWLDEHDSNLKIGIVTSAWHLPRVLRLAEKHGLDATPVPSNFLSQPFSPSPSLIVPSAENLLVTSLIVKEYLARLVGR